MASRESVIAVIVALSIWLLDVVGRLFLQKRRDDVFAAIARADENKIDIMRAISIYEAVRSRQLTPEALVSLLGAYEAADRAEASAQATTGEVRQQPRPHRSQSPQSTT